MPQFGSKDERLEKREAELEKQLREVREEKERRRRTTTHEMALDRAFHDPRYSSIIAEAILAACGGDAPQAAKLLSTSVSDLHNIKKQKPRTE